MVVLFIDVRIILRVSSQHLVVWLAVLQYPGSSSPGVPPLSLGLPGMNASPVLVGREGEREGGRKGGGRGGGRGGREGGEGGGEGGREGERKGGREGERGGGREREGRVEGGREGGREGRGRQGRGREGGWKGGSEREKEGGRDGWREGGRERGVLCHTHVFYFKQEFFYKQLTYIVVTALSLVLLK